MFEWDYSSFENQQPYGGDDVVYKLGMEFLDGYCDVIEDWGCGTAYAKKFVKKSKYIGIDGSLSRWTNKVADLSQYRSTVDGIFMRGVLEHNYNWQEILINAIASFTKRMVLATFTPYSDGQTNEIRKNSNGSPDLSFNAKELESYFDKSYYWHKEDHETKTQYKTERIYFICK